jgi:hypothetical protein
VRVNPTLPAPMIAIFVETIDFALRAVRRTGKAVRTGRPPISSRFLASEDRAIECSRSMMARAFHG